MGSRPYVCTSIQNLLDLAVRASESHAGGRRCCSCTPGQPYLTEGERIWRGFNALLADVVPQIPTPEKIMKPAGRPEHYKRVAEGYERALEGKKRPYWKIFFNIW